MSFIFAEILIITAKMIITHFFLDSRQSEFGTQRRKEWIMAAAGLAASIGSSIFGGAKAAKAAKAARRAQKRKERSEQAWYDRQYNTDYMDTAAGRNLMRKANEVQDNYIRKADGAAAVGGGTAASVAQAKEAANKTIGNTIADIAASDTSRKQQVADVHQTNLSQFADDRAALANQRAENTTQAAQDMSNAMMTAAGSLESGAKSGNNNKLGGAGGASDTSLVSSDVAERLKNEPIARATGAGF